MGASIEEQTGARTVRQAPPSKIVFAKIAGSAKTVEERVMANTAQAVSKYFAPLSKEGQVIAAPEAGCVGSGLSHQLTEL
jgi:hypothetical protein